MNVATTKLEEAGEAAPTLHPDPWPSDAAGGDDDPGDAPDESCAGHAMAAGSGFVVRAATDAELAGWIARAAEQDERALAALYDATFSRVFGLVRRIVRDTGLAEEVVEDAYFQVWRQALRYDPARGHALAWLLAIARSRAIDALRREQRFEHEALDEQTHPETPAATPPVDELLELARHRADLHQALMRLGAQPRQMVSMSFFRGLSHEEIADQMGLPLGTVKSQIRRALLALRQLLGDNGVPELAS